LLDRQVISYETFCETFGYYFPKELERLKKEKKLRDSKGILVMQSAPTQQAAGEARPGQPPADGQDKPGSAPAQQKKKKAVPGNGLTGRPAGVKEPGGERKGAQGVPKSPKGMKAAQ